MTKVLPAGTVAPGFTLRVTPDQYLSLSDLAGRPVVRAQRRERHAVILHQRTSAPGNLRVGGPGPGN